ncbi:hypothetical protein SAMN05421821_103494 [Mucilaginibacter lappiensis]|uniref:Uncharacterized protein n=1 Tax=Mucilaginibacter lappiensis TaxID=354630 RepID=A0ABR6PHN4_9SPHI|nr:hypothetical protein [Mucilaginibacter lappiensis]SIQ82061.1 hypothetical protein SAMN05421821_103494 [Mucilaginibacter lappiensis]
MSLRGTKQSPRVYAYDEIASSFPLQWHNVYKRCVENKFFSFRPLRVSLRGPLRYWLVYREPQGPFQV